jgi:ABC-type multidrug transport system fused ATPase/permease subunit
MVAAPLVRGRWFGSAAGVALGAALAAAVPSATVAYILYRAFAHAALGQILAASAGVVLVALGLRIVLATVAGRLVRRGLAAHAERLRVEIVDGLRSLPVRRLRDVDAGRTVALLTTGLDEAVDTFGDGFDAIFGGVANALLVGLLLIAIDWRIGLVALAFLPLTAIYLWQSRKISARAAPRLHRARSEGTSRFFEYVESLALLRSFGRTTERAQRLGWALQELKIKAFETSIAPIPFGVLALFFIEFGFAIAVMVGTEVNAGAAGFAVTRYLVALVVALSYFQTLFDAADGYLRLRDARVTWDEIARVARNIAPVATDAPAVPEGFDIVVDGVDFAYDRGPVLDGVSCRIAERGVTAVVGRSGAGKSAFAGILAGLNLPAGGRVLVGGADLADIAAAERTRLITLVFQDTELVAGTVAANIAAGRPGAREEQIRAAGRLACCDDFIERLPAGYETLLRAGAPTLSLGERQRIAIARALVGGAPIVVFDECTASLDPGVERAVHAAMEALAARSTVILITHRLATVRNAQRILVLAGGRIVESGRHAELIARDGEYAGLWSAYEAAHAWSAAG